METSKKNIIQAQLIGMLYIYHGVSFRRIICFLTVSFCLVLSGVSWAVVEKDSSLYGARVAVETETIQPGDIAEIQFLCRLHTGEVVAATESIQEGERKSNVFVKRSAAGPVSVVAILPDEPFQKMPEESFDQALLERLARSIVGMKNGERRQLEILAQESSAKDNEYYIVRIARVRIRPKIMTMQVDAYKVRTGKSPEVGQSFTIDPAFPGRVTSVKDTQVTIRFYAIPGDVIETPFGPGRIYHDEKNYKLDINARKGSLVRSGPLVGRISGVNDTTIIITYRHPFGYEALSCDVKVEKAADKKISVVGSVE